MRTYWVVATRDNGENKMYYFSGESFYGGYEFSNVLEATRWESLESLCAEMKHVFESQLSRFTIVRISEATFEALEKSFNADRDLFTKFHDPNYVT